jgi:ElaB/YqjD/DUF883 family membrane-anchored ribosome-binding protein
LYLANLAVIGDMNHDPEEWQEPPVPAGLDQLTAAQTALAEFYGLREALPTAAARNAPKLPARTGGGKRDSSKRDGGNENGDRENGGNQYDEWLARQPEAVKNEWLAALMADPQSAVRSQLLVEFRKSQSPTLWPTAHLGRTMAELESAAVEIQEERSRRKTATDAKSRARRLKKLANDPEKVLRETEQLVSQRANAAYEEAASLLADLRESLTGTRDSALADRQAQKLKSSHPKSGSLAAALRKQGFLKKPASSSASNRPGRFDIEEQVTTKMPSPNSSPFTAPKMVNVVIVRRESPEFPAGSSVTATPLMSRSPPV